jgi:hypothetical protein
MIVFGSLNEALRAGYQVEDRTEYGFLVRTRTGAGWARAMVVLRVFDVTR